MAKKTYPVLFSHTSSEYSAEVPDIPGAFSEGKTLLEAKKNVALAITETLQATGVVPEPTPVYKISNPNDLKVLLVTVDI